MNVQAVPKEFKRSFDEVSGIYISALRDGARALQAEDEGYEDGDDAVIYRDEVTQKLCDLAENVACTPSTVLLSGETGVGKEVFARFIHRKSKRSDGPLVAINCAALAASLLESELFGHEKGAFSNAVRQHIGVFEQADGGTLLLDEISEMPHELQVKLLRVIQEREILRVGGTERIDVDIRIIATTNRDLAQFVDDGHFRQDLYFRLNVFPLEVPPLRERRRDIEPLARYYCRRLADTFDSSVRRLSGDALRRLEQYDFPGNIRELVNIIERALILATGTDSIDYDHIVLDQDAAMSDEAPTAEEPHPGLAGDTDVADEEHMVEFRAGDRQLTDIRRVVIERTLERYDGNRTRTAESLGVSARTIRNKLKDYRSEDESS